MKNGWKTFLPPLLLPLPLSRSLSLSLSCLMERRWEEKEEEGKFAISSLLLMRMYVTQRIGETDEGTPMYRYGFLYLRTHICVA